MIRRWLLVLLCATTWWSLVDRTGAAASDANPEIAPVFRRFYETYGGVRIFGYPLTGPLIEHGRLVQYFERQRFEYHPEHRGTEFEVLLGHLGRQVATYEGRDTRPTSPKPGHRFFPETGHNLAPQFTAYWEAHGGLRLFGYPITEPFWEQGLLVQYTERARFEFHPDKAGTPWQVLLGRLGAIVWQTQQFMTSLPTSEDQALASLVLERLNKARSALGLQSLSRDPALDALAAFRSNDMASRSYFSHTTPEGLTAFDYFSLLGISWTAAGETLQRNNLPGPLSAEEAARSLLASPSHRTILLDERFTHAGVGCARDAAGLRYFTVIVVRRP
ncbi:MAG: CAP domain-containing protein [Dehalococcoidia bacterium]|nr:CAP domain-containing protein [Dehalococcoidia bacterium]